MNISSMLNTPNTSNLSNKEAFDRICGDCAGVNFSTINEKDVRKTAEYWNEFDDLCSEELITSAIKGLKEYQGE